LKPIRFIHAADLHLDTPFKGLTGLPNRLRTRIRESTFHSLSRLVEIAISEAVDFVLISGDVYDLADRSLRAQLRFLQAAEALANQGIRLFVIHGNHDPLTGARASLKWPAETKFFDSKTVETVPVTNAEGEIIATVSGISYEKAATTDNLASIFPKPNTDVYAIAMLHTNVDGDVNHDNYAPCSKEQLIQAGYHYWALGHIHSKRVLHEEPHIVYPGNIQGRSVKEIGSKGCFLVEVDELGQTKMSFRATEAIRWAHLACAIQDWQDEQQLKDGLEQAIDQARAEAGGLPVIVRITLTGRGPLHHTLQEGFLLQELIDELRNQYSWASEMPEQDVRAEDSFVWIESCKVETRAEIPFDQLLKQESFIGDLLRITEQLLSDEAALQAFSKEAFAPLLSQARPAKLLADLNESELEQWLLHARDLAVDELLGEVVSNKE
jgi:exonuclease SbcD